MPVGYRNSAGVDWENLFEPGTTTAPGYRRANGSLVAFAPRNGLPKGPNLGARNSAGVDLSNLWLPKGSAPPIPGFNGGDYDAAASAPSGSTGTTSAQLRLTMRSDGTWTVERTLQGSVTGDGAVVIDSGVWLPAGQSASNYTVQYAPVGTGGTDTNDAPNPVSLGTSRSYTLVASVLSASMNTQSATRSITTTLTRTGAGAVNPICVFRCEAQGQV